MREGRYDVGRIVREVSAYYLESDPNHVTRVEIRDFLERLTQFTEPIRALGAELVPGPIRTDLERWMGRLQAYRDATDTAPAGHSQALAEQVAAPLLLGWFPGSELQQPPDLATPFSIANQIEVSRDFRRENLARLSEELAARAKVAGYSLGMIGLAFAGGFAVCVWRPWRGL